MEVSSIYTSPVLRAKQTAHIIGKSLVKDVFVDKRLRERYHGKLENHPTEDGFWKLRMLSNSNLNVESWDSMAHRLRNFMESRKSPGKGAIVSVSHESVILSLLSTTLGFDEFTGFSLKLRNASASIVEYGKRVKVLGFGMPVLTKDVLKKYK